MGLYTTPHSGHKVYRTRVPFKDIHRQFDMTYGEVVPVLTKFCLPGDVWKISANALIRYKKMLSPTLTKSDAFFRFFFVPLRQVVDNLEEIITGSKNGSLIGTELPTCKNYVQEWIDKNQAVGNPKCVVRKYTFWPMLGQRHSKIQQFENSAGTQFRYIFPEMNGRKDDKTLPAYYWYKAYCRIIWDYFRDENYQSFDGDFEKFYEFMLCNNYSSDVLQNGWFPNQIITVGPGPTPAGTQRSVYAACVEDPQIGKRGSGEEIQDGIGLNDFKIWFCDLRKDYFWSSLPWIMKGIQPTISSVISGYADFSNAVLTDPNAVRNATVSLSDSDHSYKLVCGNGSSGQTNNYGNLLKSALNQNVLNITSGFTAQDVRDMFAETRIFERLARCGSRYVEYLEANFGIAPRDDTLQRPLYLGGFSQPIVTTEVVQTGGDSDDVGTLRGHGISSYGNSIKPFVAAEFGLIFGLMYVTPKTEYAFQNRREFSYKSRFDFFNPSLQLLSEQQVMASELYQGTKRYYYNWDDDEWDDNSKDYDDFVLGYQGMYNELRYDNDLVCRSLTDTESYWTQALNVPLLYNDLVGSTDHRYEPIPINGQNMSIASWLPSLLEPFESTAYNFRPMIVDFDYNIQCYRPMVRDPIPGLTDHN